MKLFFVIILLVSALFILISSLDLLMGTRFKDILWKEADPFMVMEPAEIFLILLILFFFFSSIIMSFFKNKKESNPPSNES